MKEFSKMISEDRRFEIGGEVYEWIVPEWETFAAIFDEDSQLLAKAIAEAEAEAAEDAPAPDTEATPTKDGALRVQARIKLFLADEDHKRFDALCKRKKGENPVPIFLFTEVYRWLLEVASGRPTTPPSDSEPGGGNGAASSPAVSRSRGGSRRR